LVNPTNRCAANPDELNIKILDCKEPDITKDDHLPRNTYRNCDDINCGCDNGTCDSSFSFACVTESDVLKSMLLVKSNATGVDDINPKFIKILLPKILPYITFIYNTALTQAIFPDSWKLAKVIPIPKSANEYRPISVLPYLSKVFERLVAEP